jgi:hypothetical protein
MKTSYAPKLALVALFALAGIIPAQASLRANGDDVEIEIVDDWGRTFHQHPVSSGGHTTRAYVEAKRGTNYSIRVSNNSEDRIGLVIAVDGRNIISGKKSHLHRSERKYVLGPYQTAEYEGWRTAKNRVSRFYFTDAAYSYAEAFDDASAMGVLPATASGGTTMTTASLPIRPKKGTAGRGSAGTPG